MTQSLGPPTPMGGLMHLRGRSKPFRLASFIRVGCVPMTQSPAGAAATLGSVKRLWGVPNRFGQQGTFVWVACRRYNHLLGRRRHPGDVTAHTARHCGPSEPPPTTSVVGSSRGQRWGCAICGASLLCLRHVTGSGWLRSLFVEVEWWIQGSVEALGFDETLFGCEGPRRH